MAGIEPVSSLAGLALSLRDQPVISTAVPELLYSSIHSVSEFEENSLM